MLTSYEAIYEQGRLHWLAEAPPGDAVKVIVTVVEPAADAKNAPNGQRLARLLEDMADLRVGESFGDPLQWQREQREDRPLPGREDP